MGLRLGSELFGLAPSRIAVYEISVDRDARTAKAPGGDPFAAQFRRPLEGFDETASAFLNDRNSRQPILDTEIEFAQESGPAREDCSVMYGKACGSIRLVDDSILSVFCNMLRGNLGHDPSNEITPNRTYRSLYGVFSVHIYTLVLRPETTPAPLPPKASVLHLFCLPPLLLLAADRMFQSSSSVRLGEGPACADCLKIRFGALQRPCIGPCSRPVRRLRTIQC